MEVSTNETHDVEALPALVEESGRNVRVVRVISDGACDSSRVYGLLRDRGLRWLLSRRPMSGLVGVTLLCVASLSRLGGLGMVGG